MAIIGGTAAERPMLNALTGLRALAAGWVVLYHFRADFKLLAPSTEPLWPFLDSGYAGVDIFFVLSGFIIAYTYLGRLSKPSVGESGRFLWLRLARLYPVHIATVLAFALILTPGSFRDITPGEVWANLQLSDFYRQLFLVHAWGTDGNRAWNYPAWSISSEWFAYLLFPLAAIGLARVVTAKGALIGMAASHAFNIATFFLIAAAGYQGEIILVRIVGEFAAGCFLFLLWRRGWAFDAPWQWLTPLFAASSLIVTLVVNAWGDVAPVIAAPLYGGLIYGLALERDALSRLLATPSLVYAGEASYALYMTHALVQRFTWEFLPATDFTSDGRLVRAGVLGLYAALLAVTAVLVYELVEKPARDGMRRAIRRRPARPALAPIDHAPVIGLSTNEEPISARQPRGGS